MSGRRGSKLIAAAIAGTTLLLGACASDSNTKSNAAAATNAPSVTEVAPATQAPAAVTTPATSPTVAATTPASVGVVTTPATTGGKVNINDASVPELEKAFKAAGVTNSHRWAQEVDEYRPYPHDEQFAKLRQELGKYNIDPKILELIISTLEF